jgi:hypothetical protein
MDFWYDNSALQNIQKRIMMARDRKFGYHWIWITPIASVALATYSTLLLFLRIKSSIARQIKARRYPHLKDIRTLAGIGKKE